MEPMTLSPCSGGAASPTTGALQYLPGFLLGEHQEGSEGTAPRSRLSMTGRGGADGASSFIKSPLLSFHTPDYNRGSKQRVDGPPTQGLFDDVTGRTLNSSRNFNNSMNNNTQPHNSAYETSQQFETWDLEKSDESEGFWVVVFGFPPAHMAQVLAIFTQLGRVTEHSFPSNGNWLYIKYESRLEVRKALAHNERIICGNIMIGVSERRGQNRQTWKSATCRNGDSVPCSAQIPESTPLRRDQPTCRDNMASLSTPIKVTPKSPNLRNLTAARRDNMVIDNFVTPTKNTSVVSKAMDLLFGW